MLLEGRVALVTGAGSGIGRATALLLAREGARVAALSRTEEELREVVDEIQAGGGEGMVVTADVSQADEVRSAVDRVAGRWGRLDVVFANAGVNGVWAPLEELAPEEWSRTIAINLGGTFHTVKYAAPLLKKQGGSVVITASINGTRVFSNTGATAYACSKAAQVAFAKMTALELAPHRVRVNVICPGAITTEIQDNTEHRDDAGLGVPVEFPEGWHPLRGAPGTPEQVARLVLFLASDAADQITGTEVWIDGGESLVGIHG
ncbi:MAG TPA: SDR family NAD(P)-dependent oxidoreductase [Longimicrobiaceae bacterium]|nr:SDR family NAD(P)-dependent oxidoreductase [Longimicrobiaceae bacterium]